MRRNASIAGWRQPISSTRVLWAHPTVACAAARFTRPDLPQLLQRSQRWAKSIVLPSLDISTIARQAAFALALTIATGSSRDLAAGAVREKLPMIDGKKIYVSDSQTRVLTTLLRFLVTNLLRSTEIIHSISNSVHGWSCFSVMACLGRPDAHLFDHTCRVLCLLFELVHGPRTSSLI